MKKSIGTSQGFIRAELAISGAIVIVLIIVNILLAWYLGKRNDDLSVISDINQIRAVLAYSHAVNTKYPEVEKAVRLNNRDAGTQQLCLDGFHSFADICKKILLEAVPNGAQGRLGDYLYSSAGGGKDYKIQFDLFLNNKAYGLSKGLNCASESGLAGGPCAQ